MEKMNDSPALYNSLFFFFLDRSFLPRIKLQYGLFSSSLLKTCYPLQYQLTEEENCKFSLSGIMLIF